MPVKILSSLPATKALQSENICFVIGDRFKAQEIHPLRVVILNLMPIKAETETQLLRVLSNTPLLVDITLMRLKTHQSKNTPRSYLEKFYKTFHEIKDETFDGMIITGAPVERIPFERVDYWTELCEVMSWSKKNVRSTLSICWGALAGLYFHYGIEKHVFPQKISGVFQHSTLAPLNPLVRGFDDVFWAPHSRYAGVWKDDVAKRLKLEILAESDDAGVHIVAEKDENQIFVTGHGEYDRNTLKDEYNRDLKKGIHPAIPKNYFPNDDPQQSPLFLWRSHAYLMFSNWLQYFVCPHLYDEANEEKNLSP